MTIPWFPVLLYLSFTLPDHVPHFSFLGSGHPPLDGTASLWRRVFRLLLLVTRWRSPRLLSSNTPLLPLQMSPDCLSSTPSSQFLSPFLPTIITLIPFGWAHCHTRHRSHPRPRLCSRFHSLHPISGALFSPRNCTVGQAPGLALEAAGYLKCLVFHIYIFIMWRIPKLVSSLSFLY